jgi:2-oxoglutarate ferredoxin oxidoreductase subunit delta
MNDAGYYPPEVTDQEACTGCRNCMIYCPDFAIAVEKDDKGDSPSNDGRG